MKMLSVAIGGKKTKAKLLDPKLAENHYEESNAERAAAGGRKRDPVSNVLNKCKRFSQQDL